MDTNLERLHRALADAIRSTRGDFDEPVTVSQIYQQLVPYRTARAAVGFEMNADYEYTLLRLLAGEGELARLEPAEVREVLRMELSSPNPNVSLFRDYANCDVWVSPADAADVMEDEDEFDLEALSTRRSSGFIAEFIADEELEDEIEEDEPQQQPDPPQPTARAAASQHAQRQCSFCGGDLPPGRLVNYCPFCGNDLTRRPCASCGEVLDPMWRFCISCGAAAKAFDTEEN